MSFSTFNSIHSFIVRVKNIIIETIIPSSTSFPAVDASLVLYYPLDVSLNTGTPNYAAGFPEYDASLNGAIRIINANNNFITGIGDLYLNNTMGGTNTTTYALSTKTFSLLSKELSISCWFSCSGELGNTGTLVSLANGAKTVELNINGMNNINGTFT